MKNPSPFTAFLFLFLLGSPLVAQVTSPGGFLSTEGDGLSALFGGYPQCRFMVLDGERRGMTTRIKEMAFRHDNFKYGQTTGMGRTWSSVTIAYAPCDLTNVTNVFSQVALSTPTRVFAGSVTWPTILQTPPTRPAPWGGPQGQLRFPLSSTIVASGVQDLSFDFTFRGGVLANAAAWTGHTGIYVFDSYRLAAVSVHVPTLLGDGASTTVGCLDSDPGIVYSGASLSGSESYNATHSDPKLAGNLRLYFQSFLTAPAAPVIHAIGFGGFKAGVVFPGVTCNKLYVDLGKPLLLISHQASPGGYAVTDFGLTPNNPRMVGVELWFQPAWADSRTGAVQLARALQTGIVAPPVDYNRKVIYAMEANAQAGFGPMFGGTANPIARYGQ